MIRRLCPVAQYAILAKMSEQSPITTWQQFLDLIVTQQDTIAVYETLYGYDQPPLNKTPGTAYPDHRSFVAMHLYHQLTPGEQADIRVDAHDHTTVTPTDIYEQMELEQCTPNQAFIQLVEPTIGQYIDQLRS